MKVSNNCIVLLVLMLCHSYLAKSQLCYPIVGTYNGKSAQSMAIWEDNAYLFNNGGHCRVLDLKTGNIIHEFNLDSSGNNIHVASACFGKEFWGKSQLPVLYLAEFTGSSRCFVESIISDSSIIVQTIEAKEKGKNYIIQCWLVNLTDNSLYSVSGLREVDSKGRCPVVIRKYRLPLLSEGKEIFLTEKDKYDEFILDFPNCLQDAAIRDDKIYIATGFQQSKHLNPRGKRSLKVIDLCRKKMIKEMNLTYVTTNEPEGLAFYRNKLFLFCGQEGGIYEIKY